ncbi:formate dehydrogenase subunit delta [Pandoraea nosoerga]|uniref:Formate dehydrogenase n=1 Tax=Pandoraea nosoerga TaxID=2508296 RepID=A0A5E4SUN3_9BURK|nr:MULTISPECIES: formate dehydrogenase subunit delta [Pandoraea]MBN4666466.1 formate dehydrogenase subunit delta [Pandoraea nosoerga]MBN4677491.1 formate dehydrogenase subunit delta [Pandoraea nosoerga]MBN4682311.1 formate dehydrogenase subunit delta [Pandoraea nosoerga]MBN4745626.1 formate dehydrogenase subunit delta [Pandoraea nosoerga]VVD78742.1 formate dehydrogenase [Pandoraea nosoerga]
MDGNNLVRMANRIADFFESLPDREEAVAEVAAHLRKFWDPRMRAHILAMADTPAADAMHALVREALSRHRERLAPAGPVS